MSQNITHIFLVDDDEDDRDLFNDAINEIPLETRVHTYSNGNGLIAHLEDESYNWPQLIFIDYNMPIMGGEECVQKLRGIHKLDMVPIIVYSTTIIDSVAGRLSEMGANMYLQKPSSFPQLKSQLKDCMTILLKTEGERKGSWEFTIRENR